MDTYRAGLSEFGNEYLHLVLKVMRDQAFSLQSKRGIELKPCETEYENSFYEWRNDWRLISLFWTQKYEDKSRERLREEMEQLITNSIFYVVVHHDHQKPVGFVCARGCASANQRRNLDVLLFVNDAHRGRGYGIVAFILFINYLFQSFDVVKIVFEVNSLELATLRIMKKVEQLRLEGIRLDHVCISQQSCDVFEYALSRDSYESWVRHRTWNEMLSKMYD